jgi:DinB superfamily
MSIEPIEPDTKDWTWVLERPCPECGFDASTVSVDGVADLVRDNAAQWPAVLTRPDVRRRPRPDRWSPLEYACHVRDVFLLFDRRLHLMLDEDDPLFANWDQDETAAADRYGEQDPATVASELVAAAETLSSSYESVTDEQHDRPGRRSDGAHFTVATFARYLAHDPVHHLWDVNRAIS